MEGAEVPNRFVVAMNAAADEAASEAAGRHDEWSADTKVTDVRAPVGLPCFYCT